MREPGSSKGVLSYHSENEYDENGDEKEEESAIELQRYEDTANGLTI